MPVVTRAPHALRDDASDAVYVLGMPAVPRDRLQRGARHVEREEVREEVREREGGGVHVGGEERQEVSQEVQDDVRVR